MFDLDTEIRRWREGLTCRSFLSPRETDELEDHLRARVELEMELDAALAPNKALAIVRKELGQASELASEFAKAGKPRWRRWLVAGLGMFGVSFVLPVFSEVTLPFASSSPELMRGWEAFLAALNNWENPIELLSPLSNGLVLVTLLMLRRRRPPKTRWLTGLMTGSTALNLYWAVIFALDRLNPLVELGIGYWTWLASFGCLTATLWLRDHEWASARTKRVVA